MLQNMFSFILRDYADYNRSWKGEGKAMYADQKRHTVILKYLQRYLRRFRLFKNMYTDTALA